MAKLKTTLPKDFSVFYYSREFKWTAQDIEKCKEMLSTCEANARDRGGYKQTALHYLVPIEIAQWLIERGADVNIANTYGTPLFKHAYVGNYDVCKLLIEHGADVNIENYAGETALFSAADRAYCDVIELLLEHGADPCHHAKNFNNSAIPLFSLLRSVSYVPEQEKADAAELLVNAQRKNDEFSKTDWKKAQDYIAQTGHMFEVNKSELNSERRAEGEATMARLYKLFDVAPADSVIKHDAKSPILVNESLSINGQHNALWEFLVPTSGMCATIQGEVIRITGRIDTECNANGGANWDGEYRKMINALVPYFAKGNAFDEKNLKSTHDAAREVISCKLCGCDDAIAALIKLAIDWVKLNPEPIPLNEVNYCR